MRCAILILQEIASLQNFLKDKQRVVRYSARNFEKSSASKVTKIQNAGLLMVRSQPDQIYFRIREIVE